MRPAFGVDRGEQRHRLLHQGGGGDDDVGHFLHAGGERALVEHHDGLGGLLHLVDGVVHRGDQVLDVAAVERRDEGAPDRDQHLAGDVVGVLLAIHDGLVVDRDGVAAFEHGAQRLGAGYDRIRMPGKEIEEALLPRQQRVKPSQHGGSRLAFWQTPSTGDSSVRAGRPGQFTGMIRWSAGFASPRYPPRREADTQQAPAHPILGRRVKQVDCPPSRGERKATGRSR